MRNIAALLLIVAGLASSAIAQTDEPARDTMVISRHISGGGRNGSWRVDGDSIVASDVTLRTLIERSIGIRFYSPDYRIPILGISDEELDQRFDLAGVIERPPEELAKQPHRSETAYMLDSLLARHFGVIAKREKRKLEDKEFDVVVVRRVTPPLPVY